MRKTLMGKKAARGPAHTAAKNIKANSVYPKAFEATPQPQRATPFTAFPGRYYADEAMFEREKEAIFMKSWQFVCHESELAKTSDIVTANIAGQEIFVVRDKDAVIRAFYNVCQHRAHQLVRESGSCKGVLVCPYHGWTYDLDGRLRSARNHKMVDGFVKENIHLSSLKADTFCGFVFVTLDSQAPPLKWVVGDLDEEVQLIADNINSIHYFGETKIAHECNWKVSIENYSECYHCSLVHQQFTQSVVDSSSYRVRLDGFTMRHGGLAHPTNKRLSASANTSKQFASWYVWPNFALNSYPNGLISTRHWFPLGLRKTDYLYRWYTDGRIADKELTAFMAHHANTTAMEDAIIVEQVQKGLENRGYRGGPLMIDKEYGSESEHGVWYFQQLVSQALGLSEGKV